jgi:uncharacterized protein (DUF983 family)
MEAYCVKCRVKREMTGVENTVMKNGKAAVKGACSECGTKMFVIAKTVRDCEKCAEWQADHAGADWGACLSDGVGGRSAARGGGCINNFVAKDER